MNSLPLQVFFNREGNQAFGQQASDVIVTFVVARHPVFDLLSNGDLGYTMNITLLVSASPHACACSNSRCAVCVL